jgi:hypothetical protein
MMARPLLNHSARLLGSSGSQEQSCGQTSAQQLFLHRGLLRLKLQDLCQTERKRTKNLNKTIQLAITEIYNFSDLRDNGAPLFIPTVGPEGPA